MIRVELGEDDVRWARCREAEVASAISRCDASQVATIPLSAERDFVGPIGESAFRKLLVVAGKDYEHSHDDGAPAVKEDWDFIVIDDGVKFYVDVKTAGKANHQRMMMPERQRRKHDARGLIDLYVGARLMGSSDSWAAVEVWGYCPREAMATAHLAPWGEHPEPGRSIRLAELYPIERWLFT